MNLLEVAEMSWRQIFGDTDETRITKEEFIQTAKASFALQTLLAAYREKREEGYWEVPSYLTTEVEKEVVNKKMDISDLNVMRSLPQDAWLQNIGGLTCECKYVKSTTNLSQLLCEDDSLGDSDKPYVVMGKQIFFPRGTHKGDNATIPIIYANGGAKVDDNIEVDGAIADLIRSRLMEVYLGKTQPLDLNNNSNPNN